MDMESTLYFSSIRHLSTSVLVVVTIVAVPLLLPSIRYDWYSSPLNLQCRKLVWELSQKEPARSCFVLEAIFQAQFLSLLVLFYAKALVRGWSTKVRLHKEKD